MMKANAPILTRISVALRNNANNMALLPDDKVINMCEALKAFDESAGRCKIMFEGKKDQVVNLAKEFLERF